MDREAVHLYLLCFVHDRYQRLNDNLLSAFCSLVRRYVDEVGAATKEAIYRFKLETSEDIEQGAKVLALFLDPNIDGHTPFATLREQAHSLLPPERLQQLCRHLAGEAAQLGMVAVRSPTDGIFYRRPSPDEPSYVEAGDTVERGKVLGLVEVMKCFNQIAYGGEPDAAPKAVVVRVVPEDSAEVKLGQVLFVLDPR